MKPNQDAWATLGLSLSVALVAAWLGDLVAMTAIVASIVGAVLLG
jgi:hypothetical protein